MTQEAEVILSGLDCCSKNIPSCDRCPYSEKSIHCRELESDSATLIRNLLNAEQDNNVMIEQLLKDVDNKQKCIYELEETILNINTKFSEGDFAGGLLLLISAAKCINDTHE